MNFKAFVIDMDGVLWHNVTPLPGLKEFFETLERLELPFILATNNAMKVAEDYTEKLGGFGVDVAPERILTSSEAAASYLKSHYPDAKEVYVVGEQGLHRAVREQGFQVVSPKAVKDGAFAPIVVTGLARESLTYDMVAMASLLVQKGADLVATNADSSYPTELGTMPGAGALLSVITTATGAEPFVVGKPKTAMFEEALQRLGTKALETAMIGDRLNTDIKGGKAAGMGTILVLSGISSREDVETSEDKPDFVFEDIRELTAELLEGKH